MPPPVVAVLVAHGASSPVDEALASLERQTYRDIEVIVVKLAGAEVAPSGRVIVVDGPPRASFPEAVAWGLDNAGGIRAAYVLLVHDDAVLATDAVARMVERASEEGVAAVGAKLVEWDDALVLQEVGSGLDRFAVRRSALDTGEVDAGQRDDTGDVLFCSDACLLVRADAYAELHGLDHGSWPLYEDVDLCWRLRAFGRRVVVATDARVRHAAALSRGRRTLDAADLTEAAERGRLRFVLKHFSPFGVCVVLPQLFVAALARTVSAAVTREFWRIRATVRAWASVAREVFSLRREHRAAHATVDDRELLAIGARGAILERRHERSEWLSRTVEAGGAFVRRSRVLVREPVAWGSVVAAAVVLLIVRGVLFGGVFTLGELRALPTLGGSIAQLFARVRREGLDPFGPGTPGLVALAALRTVVVSASIAEKLALLLPLAAAGVGGSRIARMLELGPRGRGWLGIGAATNPVTFLFVRDGELGALVAWAGSLWLVGSLLSPRETEHAPTERIRFYARWAIGWAVVVALHPPALVELLALGAVVAAARRDDGRIAERRRALVTGVIGAVVLLVPWSIEWFTTRTPLVGRPGWLVLSHDAGIAAATLGAGYAFVGWLVVAYGGAALVGLTRTTLALSFLGALALLGGVAGVMPPETMLVLTAACAFSLIALAARAIADELPRYELGLRHGLVVAGTAALVAMWFLSAVFFVATGVRSRTTPVIAAGVRRSGRVLWLSSTTGGVRSWTTLGFDSTLDAFPPPSGPAERMAADAVAAARAGRTHRAGSVLALADVSHVVVLDASAGRGLDEQADLAQSEVHDEVVVYRNDSWTGAAVQLPAAPGDPLSPKGLAVAAAAAPVPVSGWPRGAITVGPVSAPAGVVHLAGGPRGGWAVDGAKGRITAGGVDVPASALASAARARPPRGRRFLLPLEIVLGLAVLIAWAAAAYLARPRERAPAPRRAEAVLRVGATAAAVPAAAVAAALAIGWTGATAAAAAVAPLSSAWYCPPIGSGYSQSVAIVNPETKSTEVLVRPALGAPPTLRTVLQPRSRATVSVPSDSGAVVESYGEPIAVAVAVGRLGNRDSSLCASDASALNTFPEGGRAATLAVPRLFERYVIYNPFADVARASVRFLSKTEQIAPPPLQDVQVKPGSFVIVNPEEQFEPMLDLSTVIDVWQGRAIVARRLTTVDQVTWSLGSPARTDGLVPRASTASGETKVIVLDASDSPVHLTVDGYADGGVVPQQTFDVDPDTRTSFVVNSFAPQAQGVVLRVRSDNPAAVESLFVPKGRTGLSLLPLLQPSRDWVVPMAEGRQVVLTNPGDKAVRATIRRLPGAGEPSTVTVPAHGVAVTPALQGGQFGVLVRAAGPVTVVASGPDGSVAGWPASG